MDLYRSLEVLPIFNGFSTEKGLTICLEILSTFRHGPQQISRTGCGRAKYLRINASTHIMVT